MRTSTIFLIAGLNVLLVGCRKPDTSAESQENRPDADRLQGDWAIQSIEYGDPRLALPEEEWKKLTLRFQADRIFVLFDGHQDDEHFSFTLDPEKTPKQMAVTELDRKGQPAIEVSDGGKVREVRQFTWLYRFDGKSLVLAMVKELGGEPPNEFKPRNRAGKEGFRWKVTPVNVVTLSKTGPAPNPAK